MGRVIQAGEQPVQSPSVTSIRPLGLGLGCPLLPLLPKHL